MTPSQRPARPRYLRWLVALTIVTLPFAACGGLRARAAADWPSSMPSPLVAPAPPFPIDKAAWPAIEDAIKVMPPSGPRPSVLLKQDEASDADAVVASFAPSLDRFERAVRGGGIAVPTSSSSGPTFAQLQTLGDTWLLRARRRGQRGDRAAHVSDLASLERFVGRLSQAGDSLLTPMIALVMENTVITEMERMRELPGSDAETLAPLVSALDANISLPFPLLHGYLGECVMLEALFRDMGAKSTQDLMAASSISGATTSGSSAWQLVPRRWLYDPDRTISVVREHCHAMLRVLESPAPRGPLPTQRNVTTSAPWAYVDNRLGRVSLAIGGPDFGSMIARADDVATARQRVRSTLTKPSSH